MSGNMTADVVVVGLGAYGSAVLHQLARRGLKAVGIDRFHPPHTLGSSHGQTRITRLAVGEGDAYAPVVRRSHELWREMEAESGASLMLETGGLIMAPRDSAARHHGRENFVRRSLTMAERVGIAHERLDAGEIATRYPQFGLRGDELGYFEPTAGVLRPEACVEVQLDLARRHGATLRCGERVTAVRHEGDGVRVQTNLGTVSAARAVVTAGPWTGDLVPVAAGRHLRVYRQVLHWFEPVDPAAFAVGRFPVFIWMHGDGEEDYFYGFPVPDGASGVKVATEHYERDTDVDLVDREVSPREVERMYAEHVAGRLRGVSDRAIRSATCLYTVTPDSGFIVAEMPDQERVLTVSACSGHGFKHSAAIGEAVAQRLAGERTRFDLAPFGLDRLGKAA